MITNEKDLIKSAIQEKDKIIADLNSTLELLQMKLNFSEQENKKIEEKIKSYQNKLSNRKR